MKKFIYFIISLIKGFIDDDIHTLGAALTYKLLLAFFPFIIFLITLLGYLPINSDFILNASHGVIPDYIYNIIKNFTSEILDVKRLDLLSISLLITIFSTSSGIVGLIRGLNKAYEIKEKRNFIQVRLISLLLLVIFIAGIFISLVLIVFGDTIANVLFQYHILTHPLSKLFSFIRYLFTIFVLFTFFLLIYKLAVNNKSSFKSLLPGSIFSSVGLSVASYGFNIYINNFSSYSKIYGSIAGLFVLIMWLTIVSYVILIGGEINALICKEKIHIIKFNDIST